MNIESFIEYKAFSLSYDLTSPHPLPPPLMSVISTRDIQEEDNLLTGEEGEVGGGAESYDGENAWSSINDSILSW